MSTLIPKLQFLARSLYFSAPTAPHQTRTFFQDFARGEARFPLRAVEHFIAGARASSKPEDRAMLSEIIRGECLVDASMYSITTLAAAELRAQCDADIAFFEWQQRQCAPSRETWIAKQAVHAETMRRLIDAGHQQ